MSDSRFFQTHGNVTLVDPNGLNIDENIHNAIPKYQDMHIFVELTARRKGRSVLTFESGGVELTQTGLEDSIAINMMGIDQDPNSPTYGNFTTKWHDERTGEKIQYEGFGLTNVEIITNSSYIPQINIEFTDVRGMSFFNEKNSPYRILFDFPPPRFTLKVKGYYGRMLSYEMHLVKYTSEFKPETGNFIINGEFIAIMYAPLTDILFPYIKNVPLIRSKFVDPDIISTSRPRNTAEFIARLRNLYSAIRRKLDTTGDNESYERAVNQLNEVNNRLRLIGEYARNVELTEQSSDPILMVYYRKDIPPQKQEVERLINIRTYNDQIKNLSESGVRDFNKRLYIGFFVGESQTSATFDFGSRVNSKKNALVRFAESVGFDYSFEDTNEFTSDVNLSQNQQATSARYIYLDITRQYLLLYRRRNRLIDVRDKLADELNMKINSMVLSQLGMAPTIYNVVKLILDDVDEFFNILRDTSILAEKSHNENIDRIISKDAYYKDTTDKIYPFPLIVNKETIGCDGQEESRVSPHKLSEEIDYIFPEMDLVDDFIDSFRFEKRMNYLLRKRTETDAQGNNIWIPFAPFDSEMVGPVISPYFGVLFGEGQTQFDTMMEIMLRRYYAITQFAVPDLFNTENDELISFLAESEAANLAEALDNDNLFRLVDQITDGFKQNIENFYSYAETKEIYNFDNDTLDVDSDRTININKLSDDFRGLHYFVAPVVIRGADDDVSGDGPVATYLNEIGRSAWARFWSTKMQDFYRFTDKNLLFVDELTNDDNTKTVYLEDIWITRRRDSFISNKGIEGELRIHRLSEGKVSDFGYGSPLRISLNGRRNTTQNISDVIDFFVDNEYGNLGFNKLAGKGEGESIGLRNPALGIGKRGNASESLLMTLSHIIFRNEELYDLLVDGLSDSFDEDLSALMFLSFFGNALSPFNEYPKNINEFMYSRPGVIEIPRFIGLYLGLLVRMTENNDIGKIVDFFKNQELSGDILNCGLLIIADYFDVKNSLSENDKELLRTQSETFFNLGEYSDLISSIKRFYDQAIAQMDEDDFVLIDPSDDVYIKLKELYDGDSDFRNRIISILMERHYLLIDSTQTFKRSEEFTPKFSFTSVAELNEDPQSKNLNDNYFKYFFKEIREQIIDIKRRERNKNKENKRIGGDEDIRNQTYYSFKNINDKWLSGENNTPNTGYPFNYPQTNALIDSFAFVNRAMLPVGDTIIDPEILLDIAETPDMSVYTAISQLLSVNGFEFFPLQNFMSYDNDKSWLDAFKLDVSGKQKSAPIFVCMYIGGSSSYPTSITGRQNDFKDDGIVDLLNPGEIDFSTGDCDQFSTEPEKDNQLETNQDFPYGQVRAFRVRYGEQNQSMFTDYKVESKEHTETNESIQILSRIAGDNKVQAPIPKGQNLYSLYENRAYKATVTSLGNVMIQPTQYFQLENVPLFNGAYVILTVKHSIKPNHMVTEFSGTKLLKYPLPRVKEISAVFGFEGGKSDQTSIEALSQQDVAPSDITPDNIPDQARYESMYTEKIRDV